MQGKFVLKKILLLVLFLFIFIVNSNSVYSLSLNYKDALNAYYNKDFNKSLKILLNNKEEQKNKNLLIAQNYIQKKNPKQAKIYLDKFKNILPKKQIYIDYLYFKIALLNSDIDQAYKFINRVDNKFFNSYFAILARYDLGTFFLKQNKYDLAKHYFLSNLSALAKEKHREIYKENIIQIINIYFKEKNNKLADKYLTNLAIYYPVDIFSKKIKKDYSKAFHKPLNISKCFQNQQKYSIFCENLLKEKKYYKAIWHSKDFLHRFPNSKFIKNIYLVLGISYYKKFDFGNAVKYFKKIITYYPDYIQYDRALYYLGRSYQRLKKYSFAQVTFENLIKNFPNSKYASRGNYYLYKVYYKRRFYSKLKYFLPKYKAKFANSIYYNQLIWELAWFHIKKHHWTKAVSYLKQYSYTSPDKSMQSKILFWWAKSNLYVKNKKRAYQLFKKCLKRYPYSYYSYRITKDYIKQPYILKSIHQKNETGLKPSNKIAWLCNIGLADLAIKELNYHFELLPKLYPQDIYNLAYIYNQQKEYYKSIQVIRKYFSIKTYPQNDYDIPIDYYKFLYPQAHNPIVKKYSKKYKINPALIHAIMREESIFQNKVRSRVKAIGLMQLMPKTAKEISKKIKYPWIGSHMLEDININIHFGTYYFSYLKRHFNGNSMLMLSAYNAGPGNTRKWKQQYGTRDLDMFLIRIPFEETRYYIQKVLESFWIYQLLYS